MEKNEKKIGTLLLSGLVTGSMLGSGIIILPPLAYKELGCYSIFAWLALMFLGALYAGIFTKLNVNFKGGLPNAVEKAFGYNFKELTSYFLIFAVFSGPSVVMLTIGEYMTLLYPFENSIIVYSIIFVFLSFFILIKNIRAISKIALILSIGISSILIIGAITVLLGYRKDIILGEVPKIMSFGKTILMLFWAVVGWEVIGNYTYEVKNPEKTIKKSISLSFVIVNLVYLLIVFSMERIDLTKVLLEKGFGENKLALLLVPAFGSYGIPLMIITTIALCISTYILFVGSASRLLNNLSEENRVPKIFIKKSKNNSPYISIIFFSIIHIINIVLVGLNYLNIELLVSFANIFFISNALLGIFASMKLFKNTYNFIATFILATMLCILLIFSSKKILLIPIFMFISVFIRNKRKAINSPI
jgi:APA family basic amino acid/polyamine antiporter